MRRKTIVRLIGLSLPKKKKNGFVGYEFYLQVPVESSYVDATGVFVMELQRSVIDHIDHWAYDGRSFPGYPVQQRLKPS